MGLVCKPMQGEHLTRKEGGWVNPECAQEPVCPQQQHSEHAARPGLVGYTSKCFPVCVGELWNRSPRKTGISMLADVQILIGKGSEQLAHAVQGAQLHQGDWTGDLQAPLPSPAAWKVHPVWRGVCCSGHAGRFEAFFRGQPLSWGHCHPKIQFLLCSHQSRELSATPNWWPLSPKLRQHGCP